MRGAGFHDFGGLGCVLGDEPEPPILGECDDPFASECDGDGYGDGDGGGDGGGEARGFGDGYGDGHPHSGAGVGLGRFAPATRVDEHELRCVTPRNGDLPYTGREPLRVVLNGALADVLPPRGATVVGEAAAEANDAPSPPAIPSSLYNRYNLYNHTDPEDPPPPLLPSALPRFTYYRASSVMAATAMPGKGGALGSTLITVSGLGFADYGGLRCRFGPIGLLPTVNASLRDDGSLVCRSPPYDPADVLEQLRPGWTPPPASVAVVSAGGAAAAALAAPSPFNLQNGTLLPPTLPPLPASLPVSVILNGQSDEGGGEPSGGGATFEFGREPCEGLQLLTATAGIVDDGMHGASASYGGAPRNCSWLLRPSHLRGGTEHAISLLLTAVEVRAAHDPPRPPMTFSWPATIHPWPPMTSPRPPTIHPRPLMTSP